MHPNPSFRTAGRERNLAFVRERGFGILAVAVDDAPLISHVPFIVSADGGWVDLHLVRSNPIIPVPGSGAPARLAVSGPDGYVSPDWYGLADQVPTWNYVAVHLSGLLEQRPDGELADLLERQSAFFEARLHLKPPWSTAKMTPEVLARMMRMVVPCRLRVTEVDGTWKLAQNKPDAARLGAAEQMERGGIGAGTDQLAQLMRQAWTADRAPA